MGNGATMQPENGRTHEPHLREVVADLDGMRALMDERDRRYTELRKDDREAVENAFAASEKAIFKAEQAQTAYNVSHNDLSRKLDDQNKATIPRPEIMALFGAVDQKLESLRASFDKDIETLSTDIRGLRESRSESGGQKSGAKELSTTFIAVVGLVLFGVAILLSIASIATSIILHSIK
jgi:ABC-type Na+ efflux pump permease subunit